MKAARVCRRDPFAPSSPQLKAARADQKLMTFGPTPFDEEALSKPTSGSEVPPPLSGALAHLRARRAATAAEDLLWRYDVGRLGHKLRYDVVDDLMPQSLAEVGHALNVSPNTLRAYARVAEAIGPTELTELVALRNRFGMPLTWSHLEEIAKCRSAHARRKCAQQVISKELSVRALAKLVRTFTSDGGPIDVGPPETG